MIRNIVTNDAQPVDMNANGSHFDRIPAGLASAHNAPSYAGNRTIEESRRRQGGSLMSHLFRMLRVAILASTAACAALLPPEPALSQATGSVSDPVATAIVAELDTLMDPAVVGIQGSHIAFRELIQDFYARRAFRLNGAADCARHSGSDGVGSGTCHRQRASRDALPADRP